jgi:hypothetical protein
MKKSKKMTKSKQLVFVKKIMRPANPDPTKRPFFPELFHYGRYKGSKKLVRITADEYDAFIGSEKIRLQAERKQGSKRGQHGVVPGAGHCWPMKMEALAVHPDQVEQMNARNKRHGINVQYEPKYGMAIIPDEGEYKKLRKLEQVHHNNAFN